MNMDIKPNKMLAKQIQWCYWNMVMSIILQYNSDTAYLLLSVRLHKFKGTAPNKTVLTWDASCKSGCPQATHTSDWLAANPEGFPWPPSHHHPRPCNLTVHLYNSQKDTNWDQTNERDTQSEVGEGSRCGAYMPVSPGIRICHPGYVSVGH